MLCGALVGGASITSDAHAVGVAYNSFSGWYGYSSSTTIISNSWTSNSSNNTVAINGWQDSGGYPPANIDYEVVESTTFGWKSSRSHTEKRATPSQELLFLYFGR
jgi:hypothetical protein